MSEFETKVQQVANVVEKAVADAGTFFESAMGELNKLQAKGLENAGAAFDSATRATKEQMAFAEQLGAEWRKVVLAATKNAADLLKPRV